MRADIASPLHPCLPSGTADIPTAGEDVTPPAAQHQRSCRRKKQSSPRMRHHQMASVPLTQHQMSSLPLTANQIMSSQQQQSLLQGSSPPLMMQQQQRGGGYAPAAVTDPQTLQEKRELLEYFQKLQVLVPSLPKTGKIPKLDIIEHVINYIRKLESDLIDHPMIQVLENNAYISGLLQSMAPEFDISHLFPTRSSNTSQNTSSSAYSTPDQSAILSDSSSISSNNYSAQSAPRSLHKSHKTSHRKPFSILSTTNSTK